MVDRTISPSARLLVRGIYAPRIRAARLSREIRAMERQRKELAATVDEALRKLADLQTARELAEAVFYHDPGDS